MTNLCTLKLPEEICPLCKGVGTRVAAMAVDREYDWVHADWDTDEMIEQAKVMLCPGCLGSGHIADCIRRKLEGAIEWFPVGIKDDSDYRKIALERRQEWQRTHGAK